MNSTRMRRRPKRRYVYGAILIWAQELEYNRCEHVTDLPNRMRKQVKKWRAAEARREVEQL